MIALIAILIALIFASASCTTSQRFEDLKINGHEKTHKITEIKLLWLIPIKENKEPVLTEEEKLENAKTAAEIAAIKAKAEVKIAFDKQEAENIRKTLKTSKWCYYVSISLLLLCIGVHAFVSTPKIQSVALKGGAIAIGIFSTGVMLKASIKYDTIITYTIVGFILLIIIASIVLFILRKKSIINLVRKKKNGDR